MFALGYFALTLFTSATLLFFVQPMIGKMILPRLGGTPAVWNTCMVFFQAVLLAGYGYTHFVSTRVSRRGQLIMQAALLLTPFAVLPFSLGNWTPPGDANPVFSVLGILTVVVGVPFFVVSTTAPLMQKWFAFTDHPSAKDPYFLYGASNLGSMLALVLYPAIMEPNFAIDQQTWIWTVGYGLFVVLVLGCIVHLWAKTMPQLDVATAPLPSPAAGPIDTAIAAAPRLAPVEGPVKKGLKKAEDIITWPRRLRWIGLAAVPSSLMLGCTTYMTTDIAAIPFFWVLPLALYLATFIFVFARWPVVWTEESRYKSQELDVLMSILIAVVAPFILLFMAFMRVIYRLTAPAGSPNAALAPRTAGLCLGSMIFFIVLGIGWWLVNRDTAGLLDLGWPHVFFFLGFVFFFAFWVASGTGGPHDFVLYFQPCFLLFLVLKIVAHIGVPTWLEFTLHLLSFFFLTLMCHGELASDRPTSKHLTEFYLCMSLGGVLGGAFNAFFAPLVFRYGLFEYPMAMVLACFLRPNLTTETTLFPGDSRKGEPTQLGYILDAVIPLILGGVAWLSLYIGHSSAFREFMVERIGMSERFSYGSFLMAIPIVCVLALAMRPVRFGLALALVWSVFAWEDQKGQNWIFRDRGFFGMVKVRETFEPQTGQTFHYLIHGGIDHGRQHVDEKLRYFPSAYFHPLTGIGQIFMKMSWPDSRIPETIEEFNKTQTPYRRFTSPNWRFPVGLIGVGNEPFSAMVAMHSEPPFAVVGLGTGTLAAYAKPYQHVDIYEIDPLVLKLSTKDGDADPPFTYLMDAKARGANLNVILGDGRLKIEKAPDLWYHVICLDAFSSDAIPVHLLTVEAIEVYLKKLAPGGVLVFNATNRYVDIAGVLKDNADHLGLECWFLSDWYRDMIPDKYGTDFVMLRRKEETIEKLKVPFCGGPSLPMRLDRENWIKLMENMGAIFQAREGYRMAWEPWRVPEGQGGQLWTDRYSNLLGVLRVGR